MGAAALKSLLESVMSHISSATPLCSLQSAPLPGFWMQILSLVPPTAPQYRCLTVVVWLHVANPPFQFLLIHTPVLSSINKTMQLFSFFYLCSLPTIRITNYSCFLLKAFRELYLPVPNRQVPILKTICRKQLEISDEILDIPLRLWASDNLKSTSPHSRSLPPWR